MPSPKFYAPGRRGNGLGSERQTTDGLGFGPGVMGTMVTIIPGLSATALQMHLWILNLSLPPSLTSPIKIRVLTRISFMLFYYHRIQQSISI